jgi:hypothetical protein
MFTGIVAHAEEGVISSSRDERVSIEKPENYTAHVVHDRGEYTPPTIHPDEPESPASRRSRGGASGGYSQEYLLMKQLVELLTIYRDLLMQI